jgi:hypothetical protein
MTERAPAASGKPAYKLQIITAAELAKVEFPPINFVVPDYIPQGLTILAGRPKTGKSWLALNIALAVAEGGQAFGSISVEQGDVLYLALEDNHRRLQRRLDQLAPCGDKPARLHLATECPRLDAGGLSAIEAWCNGVSNPRLVIVDVFGQIRPERRKDESYYDGDYRALSPLKQLADRRGFAVMVVHHTNKKEEPADQFDAVSGSTGFTGAADTILILARDSNGPTLYGRGRDIAEIEAAMIFDMGTGRWSLLGKADDVRRSDERSRILATLRDAAQPLTPADVTALTNMPGNNVRRLLLKMVASGEAIKLNRGQYCHPSRSDLSINRTPGNNDHNGHKSH